MTSPTVAFASPLRAPNPPEVFEGRETELPWLGARLRSAPVSIVWGPAGIGKTGLVSRALASLPPGAVAFLSHLGASSSREALLDLAARAGEPLSPDLGRAEPAVLRQTLLDLAERKATVVVLDDVPALGPASEIEPLLVQAARHGQALRLVVISRTRPTHPDLADKTLALGPLDDASLTRLLERCGAGADASSMVARAAGSPERARRLALGGGAEVGPSITRALTPAARLAVAALRVCRIAVALPAALAEELEAHGWCRGTSRGTVLDERLRALVELDPIAEDVAREAARALVASTPGAAARVEEARLALDAGREADADALLRASIGEIVDAGAGDDLFAVLGDRGGRLLDVHRFACARWSLGGPAFAWALATPLPDDEELRLVWGQLQAHAGQLDEARAVAMALARHEEPVLRERAQLLLADVLRHTGAVDASIELLRGMTPRTPTGALDRRYRLAAALGARGDLAEAAELVAEGMDAAEGIGAPDGSASRIALGPDRTSLRLSLCSALLTASRFLDLERVLGDAEPPLGCRATELFLHLALATERGRFDRARRLLARVAPLAAETAQLRFVTLYNELRIPLTTGPHEGLEARALALVFERSRELPELVAWSLAAKAAVDVTCRPGATFEPWPEGVAEPPPTAAALVLAHRTILDARRGGLPSPDLEGHAVGADVGLIVLRARAEALVAAGRLTEADTLLRDALGRARHEGLVVEELALLSLAVDVRLLGVAEAEGAPSLAGGIADELRERAAETGSQRYVDEALVALWVLRRDRTPTGLAAIAEGSPSFVARRRAAALLGREVALDALDVRFVAAASSPRLPGASPALVLDTGRHVVTLPSGVEVDLAGHELHVRILEALARGGGRASKEELVLFAWGLPRYHKLRDDKRLQVAVHRLRHRLEADPARPTLLLRDGDAYRIAAPMRLGGAERSAK